MANGKWQIEKIKKQGLLKYFISAALHHIS